MNDDILENNTTVTTEESTKSKKDNYSIYEYLKKNTSVLIAVVSALIAIISMILKIGSYLYHIAYLNYWNIDPKLVSAPETYWLEDIALSFALLVSGMIYMGLMNETMSTFKKHKYSIKTIKTILKENEYKFNKSKVVTKKKNKKQSKKKEPNGDYDIKLNLETYKEIKKWCKQASISAWIQVVGYFFLLEIIWGIVMYIAYLKQGDINEKSSMFFFSAILISGLFIAFSVYMLADIDKEKNIKRILTHLEDNDYELPMFPIRKIGKLGVRFYLSNKFIFRGCVFMIVIFICFILMEHEQGVQDAENLKGHVPIIQIENNDYAVTAQDKNIFVVEKIDINNSNAVIYVNEQTVIPKENIKMRVYSFDSISRQNSQKAVTP